MSDIRQKFTICAFIDFDVELPSTTFNQGETWPDVYRKGVEDLIRSMYVAPATVTIVPKGIN